MSFKERLRALQGDTSVSAFARKCGLKEASIRQYLDDEKPSKPSIDNVQQIARAAGVSIEWLITGEGNRFSDSASVFVPFMDVTASAGHGSVVLSERQEGVVSFSREYLSDFKITAKNIWVIKTTGDSMEPTIALKSCVLCSSDESDVQKTDGIYVVRYNDTLHVKRLRYKPGGVTIISDNRDKYPAFDVDLKKDDFTVVGKVLLVANMNEF